MTRIAVLWNPDHADPEFQETKRAADVLKVRLQSLEVRRPDDFASAYQAALAERAEGLVIVFSRLMSRERPRILESPQTTGSSSREASASGPVTAPS